MLPVVTASGTVAFKRLAPSGVFSPLINIVRISLGAFGAMVTIQCFPRAAGVAAILSAAVIFTPATPSPETGVIAL